MARGLRLGAFGLGVLAWEFWLGDFGSGLLAQAIELGLLAQSFWLGAFDLGPFNWVFWILARGFIFGRFGLFLIHRAKCPNLQAKHCNALLDL